MIIGNTPTKEKKKKQLATQQVPLPQITPPQITEAPISTAPEVFKNTSGELSGVTLDGKTYLGLSPQDVKQIVEHQQTQTTIPQGAVSAGQAADLRRQQQLGIKLGQNVGNIPQQPQTTSTAPNWGQAIGAGVGNIIPSLPTTALSAVTGTAVGTPVVGAIAGGTALLGSFVLGVRNNLKAQTAGQITAEKLSLTQSTTNLGALITDANKNPSNAYEDYDLFQSQLILIEQSRNQLKADTSASLNKFLGEDGTPELQRYETFYSAGGGRELLIREMRIALINPNPSKNLVSLSDLGLEETTAE